MALIIEEIHYKDGDKVIRLDLSNMDFEEAATQVEGVLGKIAAEKAQIADAAPKVVVKEKKIAVKEDKRIPAWDIGKSFGEIEVSPEKDKEKNKSKEAKPK